MHIEPLFLRRDRPRIAIIAGESSGALLGASLMAAICQRLPDAQFAGIGGGAMLSQGFRSVCPMDWLAVNGYVEVLRRLPKLLSLRRALIRQIIAERPDVVVGIDAPDFNLGLERAVKRAGIPVVHYVSPSVWAWRGERVHTVQRAADHVLCLFPMEAPLYAKIGMPATYVGHPLADAISPNQDQSETRRLLGMDDSRPLVALLPGSRQSEVRVLAPLMLDAARILLDEKPAIQFLVPLATAETRRLFESFRYAKGAQDLPIRQMFGHAQTAMAAADVVVVASGTATLEAALLKKPMVITYRLARLTAWLMKRKAYLPYVGLPNVLAGEFVVPELLQEKATAENIAQQTLAWLDHPERCLALRARFADMHQSLRLDAAQRAAEVVISYIGKGR